LTFQFSANPNPQNSCSRFPLSHVPTVSKRPDNLKLRNNAPIASQRSRSRAARNRQPWERKTGVILLSDFHCLSGEVDLAALFARLTRINLA
jgi:hypothetical protein